MHNQNTFACNFSIKNNLKIYRNDSFAHPNDLKLLNLQYLSYPCKTLTLSYSSQFVHLKRHNADLTLPTNTSVRSERSQTALVDAPINEVKISIYKGIN